MSICCTPLTEGVKEKVDREDIVDSDVWPFTVIDTELQLELDSADDRVKVVVWPTAVHAGDTVAHAGGADVVEAGVVEGVVVAAVVVAAVVVAAVVVAAVVVAAVVAAVVVAAVVADVVVAAVVVAAVVVAAVVVAAVVVATVVAAVVVDVASTVMGGQLIMPE